MRLQKLGFFGVLILALGLAGCGSENLDTVESGSGSGNGSSEGSDGSSGDSGSVEEGSEDGSSSEYTMTIDGNPRIIQRGQTLTLYYPMDKAPTSALSYDLEIGGTAVRGESEDYTISNTSTIVVPAGSDTASLTITTYKKDDVYDARTLSLTITDSNDDVFTQQFLISGNVYLNDTGVTTYSDTTDFALTTQAGGDYAMQDAGYGLDVIINPNAIANNGGDSQDTGSQFYKNSRDVDTNHIEYKGEAGFRFVKIGNDGMPLPATSTNHSCVKDEITGLTWQVKSTFSKLFNINDADPLLTPTYKIDDDTRYRDFNASNFSYPWESSALSGVGPGWHYGSLNNGNGSFTLSTDPIGFANSECAYNHGNGDRDFDLYCASGSYANEANFQKVCGKSNWVVPTVEQLRSIINYEKVKDYGDIGTNRHALDETFFDCTAGDCVIESNVSNTVVPDPIYWTSSSVKGAEGLAWCVNLQTGNVKTCNKQEHHKVLVVSSNIPAEFFNPSSDNSTEAEE